MRSISPSAMQSIQDIEYLDTDSGEDRRARIHTVLCLHWFMVTLVTRQVCMGMPLI